MEKLDRQAEDLFLTDAAHGYDVKLYKMADKAALARWCALILALSDRTRQPKRLDSSVYNALFEGRVSRRAPGLDVQDKAALLAGTTRLVVG